MKVCACPICRELGPGRCNLCKTYGCSFLPGGGTAAGREVIAINRLNLIALIFAIVVFGVLLLAGCGSSGSAAQVDAAGPAAQVDAAPGLDGDESSSASRSRQAGNLPDGATADARQIDPKTGTVLCADAPKGSVDNVDCPGFPGGVSGGCMTCAPRDGGVLFDMPCLRRPDDTHFYYCVNSCRDCDRAVNP